MSQPQPPNPVADKLGLTFGLLVGLIGTMPAYRISVPYFREYALQYNVYGNHGIWELVWLICLFLFVVALARFALAAVLMFLRALPNIAILKLTLRNHTRR